MKKLTENDYRKVARRFAIATIIGRTDRAGRILNAAKDIGMLPQAIGLMRKWSEHYRPRSDRKRQSRLKGRVTSSPSRAAIGPH